jgi:hypothetical protein
LKISSDTNEALRRCASIFFGAYLLSVLPLSLYWLVLILLLALVSKHRLFLCTNISKRYNHVCFTVMRTRDCGEVPFSPTTGLPPSDEGDRWGEVVVVVWTLSTYGSPLCLFVVHPFDPLAILVLRRLPPPMTPLSFPRPCPQSSTTTIFLIHTKLSKDKSIASSAPCLLNSLSNSPFHIIIISHGSS